MAFTDAQKSDIRRYLGYSDRTQGAYSLLEGALISLSATAEAQVVVLLTDLATVEAQLRTSWGRQKVIKAEEVILASHDEIIALRKEGYRLVKQISIVLGVEILQPPFAVEMTGVAGRG